VTATALRVTVVDAGLVGTRAMWGDSSGGWQPPGASWVGRLAALGVPYDVRSDVNGPVDGLVVDPTGAAETGADNVVVGEPPPTAEETLRLLADELGAIVVPDLRNTLVLRLDDPGAAVKEHLRSWAHEPVASDGWEALWDALTGFGRVSLFCCPGYVLADGDVVDSRMHLPRATMASPAGSPTSSVMASRTCTLTPWRGPPPTNGTRTRRGTESCGRLPWPMSHQ
jgi:hypothetical protein